MNIIEVCDDLNDRINKKAATQIYTLGCKAYIDTNEALAFKFFDIAAGLGHDISIYNMGEKFKAEKDYVRAAEYFKLLANKKDIKGTFQLGLCYYYQGKGLVAFEYLLYAIVLGSPDAEGAINEILRDKKLKLNIVDLLSGQASKYIDIDDNKAIEFYREILTRELDDEQIAIMSNILGLILVHVDKTEEAIPLFQTVVKINSKTYRDVSLRLGLIYMKGEKCETDTEKGLHYIKLAADTGLQAAIDIMKQLPENYKDKKIDIKFV